MLKFKDLKQQGFGLTKQEAQDLHSKINEIAQRGDHAGVNIVFEGEDRTDPVANKPVDETNESDSNSESQPKAKRGPKPKGE